MLESPKAHNTTTQLETVIVTVKKICDETMGNQQGLFKMAKANNTKHGKDFNHPDFPHNMNGYRYGCRCEICSQAQRDYYISKYFEKDPNYKPARRHPGRNIMHSGDINHPNFPHGKTAGYNAGCKCPECKRANADKDLNYKKEKNPDYKPRFIKTMYLKPDHPRFPHGTNDGYSRGGCECAECVQAHKDYKFAYNKKWNETPKAKQRQKIRGHNYRRTKVGKRNHRLHQANRRALKKKLTPKNHETLELLRLIYLNCPKGYHVDHIIPLTEGGFHHPGNLQYLPAIINMKKGNNKQFDCSEYAIRWQDVLDRPSTIIPEGSTLKRAEALHILGGTKDKDMICSCGKP
jgi:hypothetical protein